jgi:hypothetical protein
MTTPHGMTNYLGPCDTLGRYLVGDIVTFNDIITDHSPFVRCYIPDYHQRRIRAMLDMSTPPDHVPATPYHPVPAHHLDRTPHWVWDPDTHRYIATTNALVIPRRLDTNAT